MFVLNKNITTDNYQHDNVPIKVSTTTGESIRALVSRLLAKRGLRLTSFDVFSSKVIMFIIMVMVMLMLLLVVMVMDGFRNNVQDEGKPLDLSEDCALLHCTEVSWGKMDYHV